MVATRESTFIEDISDLDASFAISEAISFAAEGKYIAEGLFKDILSFNKKAEEREYSTMEYISEAFSIGGVFKKIVDFMVKIWNSIVNFFKGLFSGGTSSSGGGEFSRQEFDNMKIGLESMNETIEKIVNDPELTNKRDEFKETSSNVGKNKNDTIDNKTVMLTSNVGKNKNDTVDNKTVMLTSNVGKNKNDTTKNKTIMKTSDIQSIKAPKTNRTRGLVAILNAINKSASDLLKTKNLKSKQCLIGKKTEDDDSNYSNILIGLISIISNIVNTGDASNDMDLAIKHIEELMLNNSDNDKRLQLNKDIVSELDKDMATIIADGVSKVKVPNIKGYITTYSDLYNGKNIREIVKKIAAHLDAELKNHKKSETVYNWVDYIEVMSANSYTELFISKVDGIGERASKIYSRVKDLQTKIGSLSVSNNSNMSEQNIADYNMLSSKLTVYQTNVQDILTVGISFCIQAMQRECDYILNEYKRLCIFMKSNDV